MRWILVLGTLLVGGALSGCQLMTPQGMTEMRFKLESMASAADELAETVEVVSSEAAVATAKVGDSLRNVSDDVEKNQEEIQLARIAAGKDPDDPYSVQEMLKLGMGMLVTGAGTWFGVNHTRDRRRKMRGEPLQKPA